MKFNYKKYLKSTDWLIVKSKLVILYLKQKWKIECYFCNSKNNLQIHHIDYGNIGNEDIEKNPFQLIFLCSTCHYKWHKNKEFRDKKEEEMFNEFINNINGRIQTNKN